MRNQERERGNIALFCSLVFFGNYGTKINKFRELSSGALCSRAGQGATYYGATKICTCGSRPSSRIQYLLLTSSPSHRHAKVTFQGSHSQRHRAGEVAPCLQTLGFLSGTYICMSLAIYFFLSLPLDYPSIYLSENYDQIKWSKRISKQSKS